MPVNELESLGIEYQPPAYVYVKLGSSFKRVTATSRLSCRITSKVVEILNFTMWLLAPSSLLPCHRQKGRMPVIELESFGIQYQPPAHVYVKLGSSFERVTATSRLTCRITSKVAGILNLKMWLLALSALPYVH